MIYRFVIVSDDIDNFKLQIAIDSTASFMQLRNVILDSVGYNKDQMDSFYICDDEWNKEKEVTCMDMGTDSDEDIWIMDDTQLDELLEDEGQRMKFVFDYMTDRYFYMILKETVPGKSLHDPLCQRKEGKAPQEMLAADFLDSKPVKIDDTVIEDLDEEFYGENAFNEEELAELNDEFREENGE